MKQEDYEEAKALIFKIDDLSKSAIEVSEMLKSLEKSGGSAKIYTMTGDITFETELGTSDTKAIFTEIQKRYYTLIRDSKRLLNDLINGLIEDTGS